MLVSSLSSDLPKERSCTAVVSGSKSQFGVLSFNSCEGQVMSVEVVQLSSVTISIILCFHKSPVKVKENVRLAPEVPTIKSAESSTLATVRSV